MAPGIESERDGVVVIRRLQELWEQGLSGTPSLAILLPLASDTEYAVFRPGSAVELLDADDGGLVDRVASLLQAV